MQVGGSILAMILLLIVFDPKKNADGSTIGIASELLVSPAEGISVIRALIMEIILSFTLVYVIFATAFDTVDNEAVQIVDQDTSPNKKHKKLTIYTASGNSKAGFAPLSIGLTLGFLCFIGGSVSGGAFNPARVLGPGNYDI
jgi:glycerol uptake facilitator-like aquaporin